jgi:hypothetical protein
MIYPANIKVFAFFRRAFSFSCSRPKRHAWSKSSNGFFSQDVYFATNLFLTKAYGSWTQSMERSGVTPDSLSAASVPQPGTVSRPVFWTPSVLEDAQLFLEHLAFDQSAILFGI